MNDIVPQGLTPEQHALRMHGVGASEVADALFNPAALWLRKTGRELPEDDTDLSALGHAIQPYIIDRWRLTMPEVVKVEHNPATCFRGKMLAHLDAIATTSDGELLDVEAKWRGHREGWGEPGTSEIPRSILLQVMAQMHCSGIQIAYVPVLFMRPPVVAYRVEYDAELAEMIEAGVNRFWQFVESDTPPEVNPEAPEALQVLRKLYPGTNGQRISAPAALEKWRAVYEDAAAQARRYEAVATAAKAHCAAVMRDAAEIEFSDGSLFRRKLVKRKGYSVEPTQYMDMRFVRGKDD